ncbi:MAG TPA: GNAT family N-acetyltransferase [Gaiellaceae bacterium]|jgi:GNAT superfamily N-acetyltransferase
MGARRGGGLMLAEASVDDLPAAAELLSSLYADGLFTVAGMRHRLECAPSWVQRRLLKWEEGERLVGWASCGLDHFSGDRELGFVDVSVDPEFRRRGIGAALLERAVEHVSACGATRLEAFGTDDDQSRAFAEARGYAVKARLRASCVDPRKLPPAPPPPPGVELRPFSELAPEAIHAVDLVVSRDIPNEESIDGLDTAAVWTTQFWRDPEVDKELSLAAVLAGEVVAITMFRSDLERGRGENDITGTLPAHRGRGLATLLKHASLRLAAERGITTVSTGNDEENAAMLAINTKLGYRPSSAWIRWEAAV